MSERPADLILVDADVWTGDATRRWAQAVAVRGDRIVAVGTDGDVRPFKGPATEVVSLPGRMVDPGLPGRPRPPGDRRAQPPQREPRRRVHAGGIPRADQGVRRREPGPRLDRGRRVVQPGLRGHRRAASPRPRRRRPGSSGLPPEHRRARRLGELPCARAGGVLRRHARSLGRLLRAGPRRRAHRHPAGRRRLRRAPPGGAAARRGHVDDLPAPRAQPPPRLRRSPDGRTPGSIPGCSTLTVRSTTRAS